VNVLSVCTANGGRSVMTERLFQRAAGGRHAARSAGSAPGPRAHPVVLHALREIGIDASDHVPQRLDDVRALRDEIGRRVDELVVELDRAA
jgi:arsenate reductase (thioredoxin)